MSTNLQIDLIELLATVHHDLSYRETIDFVTDPETKEVLEEAVKDEIQRVLPELLFNYINSLDVRQRDIKEDESDDDEEEEEEDEVC